MSFDRTELEHKGIPSPDQKRPNWEANNANGCQQFRIFQRSGVEPIDGVVGMGEGKSYAAGVASLIWVVYFVG